MKSITEKTIRKYLPSLKLKRRAIKLQNLPAFYRGIYDFEELDIRDMPFLVISVKDKSLGPKDFKKHSKILKEKLNYPQIWYLKELHFNKVKRMIENEINFIIEDKHVHLPSINVSIKPEAERVRVIKGVSGISLNIMIREILKGDLTGKSKVEIAKLLKTSKMTIGRALEPLLAKELCEEKKIGVAKRINFKDRKYLWKYFKESVNTPVKEVIFIDKIPKALPFSGITVLSKLSLIADVEVPTFACEKKVFYKKFKNTKPILEEFSSAKVELWDRPLSLIEDGCINIIDLYLVLKDTSDERVQIELETVLKNYELELG